MEKLSLRSLSSQAKIVGTMVSITGALVVILYSGPVLITMHATQKSPAVTISFDRSTVSSESNWIIGGVLLAASYVMVSIWYIYQVHSSLWIGFRACMARLLKKSKFAFENKKLLLEYIWIIFLVLRFM